MEYIEICEWDKFQHYKHRNPPWVKLYSSVLDDDDFDCMPDASKLLFFCLLPFASRRNNEVRLDYHWLQKKLPIGKTLSIETLQPLIDAGFITIKYNASVVLADCKQDAMPEKRRVEESREETEKKILSLDFVLLTPTELQMLNGQFGAQGTKERITQLNNWIGSKGTKYDSHYHTILNFERRNVSDEKEKNKDASQDCHKCRAEYIRGKHKYTIDKRTQKKIWTCETCKARLAV